MQRIRTGLRILGGRFHLEQGENLQAGDRPEIRTSYVGRHRLEADLPQELPQQQGRPFRSPNLADLAGKVSVTVRAESEKGFDRSISSRTA